MKNKKKLVESEIHFILKVDCRVSLQHWLLCGFEEMNDQHVLSSIYYEWYIQQWATYIPKLGAKM